MAKSYFKNPLTNLPYMFDFDVDPESLEWFPEGLVQLSDEEGEAIYGEDAVAATLEREWRNSELEKADKAILIAQDAGNIPIERSWRNYRIALRNWPSEDVFPTVSQRPIRIET